MRAAYKCRAYPDQAQASVLNRTFGCIRVVWNQTLAWRRQRYQADKAGTTYAQANAHLTAMKATEELAWLNEVSSVPLQQAIRHQQAAYTAFFAKRARRPRFKSRQGRQSAEYTRSGFRYRDGALYLAKMDTPLAFTWSWPSIDPATVDPTTVTVSRDPCGRWYVSLAVDTPGPDALPATGRVAGVDLGIRDFAVTSDGQRIANPRHLARWARNLARYQRRMARCQCGSANRAKAKAKVARAHRKVRAARTDFLHKASTSMVRDHDVIVLENLAVKNMVRNRTLAKAISDCGWGTFREMIEYKAARYGRHLIVIDRWYPSSKTCSACGYLLADLSLSTRAWQCPSCGTRHDRDVNAAKNILAAGLAVAGGNPGHACGADVRHSGSSRVQSAVKQEPRPRGPESPSIRAESSQESSVSVDADARIVPVDDTDASLAERLRAICLALPEVTERPSHGAPTFFVRDKSSFVTLWADGHHGNQFPHLWCVAPPGAQAELTTGEPERFFRPPYVGGRGWIGVRLDRGIDWVEIAELCQDAYRVIAPARLAARLDG